jgi:CYTH domain-containing protein
LNVLFVDLDRYLVNTSGDGAQTRIRKRAEVGSATVHLNMTVRYPQVDGQRVEIRRNISPREYEAMRQQSDPSRVPILKLRRCFLYNDRYFQLDIYQSPRKGLAMLEAYLDTEQGEEMILPPFLKCTNVTDNTDYSMYNLSDQAHFPPQDTDMCSCEVL